MSGRNLELFRAELDLAAAFVDDRYTTMEAREKGKMPKMDSALQSYLAVARVLDLRGIPRLPLKDLRMQIKGRNIEYIREHGLEEFLPSRKQPPTNAVQNTLENLPENLALGPFVYRRESHFGKTWRLLLKVLDLSGFRKAEWAVRKRGDATLMVWSHVSWLLPGAAQPVRRLTREQLLNLPMGTVVLFYPVPSKCDPDGSRFCTKPIPLKLVGDDPDSLVYLFRDLELHMIDLALTDAQRAARPIFAEESGLPFLRNAMDSALASALAYACDPEIARHISWHSWRIRLATRLLAAKVPPEYIQACVRWTSAKSLAIYARFEHDSYWDLLQKARSQDATSFQFSALPEIDFEQRMLSVLGLQGQTPSAAAANLARLSGAEVPEAALSVPTRTASEQQRPARPATRNRDAQEIAPSASHAEYVRTDHVTPGGRSYSTWRAPDGRQLRSWRGVVEHQTAAPSSVSVSQEDTRLPGYQPATAPCGLSAPQGGSTSLRSDEAAMATIPSGSSGSQGDTFRLPEYQPATALCGSSAPQGGSTHLRSDEAAMATTLGGSSGSQGDTRVQGAHPQADLFVWDAGMCGTRGCTLPDHHLGPCSVHRVSGKRTSRHLTQGEQFLGDTRRNNSDADGPSMTSLLDDLEGELAKVPLASVRNRPSCRMP